MGSLFTQVWIPASLFPLPEQVASELGRVLAAVGSDQAKCAALAKALSEISTPPPGAERDGKAVER